MNRSGRPRILTLAAPAVVAVALVLLAAQGSSATSRTSGTSPAPLDGAGSAAVLQDGAAGGVFLPVALDRQGSDWPGKIEPPPEPTEAPTIAPSPVPTEFICPPLAERVSVNAIDVSPAEVKVKRGRWDPTSPIILAVHPGRGSFVTAAWADTTGSVYLTPLDASLNAWVSGPGIELEGDEVRGLVAHENGSAMLIVREDNLHLVRRKDSAVEYDRHLIGGGSQTVTGNKWVDSWGHEARLVWSGERYGAYSGHTQYFGARGKHQGDLLWFFDADGTKLDVKGDWDWGCSHSLDLRLAYNGTRFGPVCLSDSYPSKAFHFSHQEKMIRSEPSGDGGGYSAANLGGWVPLDDGFLMSFSSPEGRASSDVGLMHVSNDAVVTGPTWLTDTPGVEESAPHLAAFGDGYLVGWTAGETHLIAQLDADLSIEEGPVATDALIAPRNDMITLPNGDVAWGYAWDDFSKLKLVRVMSCDGGGAPTSEPPTATDQPATPVPTNTTAPTSGTPGGSTPRPTRTPRFTPSSGTPEPSNTPGPSPTPGPTKQSECSDVLENGGFEDGLGGWDFEGEIVLRDGGRDTGRYAASLLGRNRTTARLSQDYSQPGGTVARYLTFWWRMETDEGEGYDEAYDQLRVYHGPLAGGELLETASNLSGRDAWRPSAYALPMDGRKSITFDAENNPRNPTRFFIDDVRVLACSGSAPGYPALAVSPASGPFGTGFVAEGSGFAGGENVSLWAIEPGTLNRFDLPPAAADGSGAVRAGVSVWDIAGTWRLGAAGHDTLLPASASFEVTGGP